jgi:hypothetical protein
MTERIPYGGDVRREGPIFDEKSLGSWSGEVHVYPLDAGGGIVHFEVRADWTGPGLEFPGEPEPAGPVTAGDVFVVGSPELAKKLAGAAADELRQDRQPVLVELADRLGANRGGPGENGAI